MEGHHLVVRLQARRVHKVVQIEVDNQHQIVRVRQRLAAVDQIVLAQRVQEFPNPQQIAVDVQSHREHPWVGQTIRRVFVRELLNR